MKKTIMITLLIIALVGGLFILTGCTKSGGLDLTNDFKHMNGNVYSVHLNLNKNDEITEFDKEEPNYARIENKENNYVADITLDTESKEAYDGYQTSAKDCEGYKEVDFGKYKGFYAKDNDDIFGYILLDESDETFNVFVNFVVYAFDENAEGTDSETLYNSSNIQNILNSINFKVSK